MTGRPGIHRESAAVPMAGLLSLTTVLSLAAILSLAAPRSAVAQQDAQATDGGAQITPDGILFEFQNADLGLVLNALAEAGGLNLVYGELPRRSVTLRLSEPVGVDQIPALLESIATANGLEVVEDGVMLRLSLVDGTAVGTEPQDSVAPAERRLYVYRLQHARAAQLANTLQSIFGAPGSAGPAPAFGLSNRPLSEQLRSQGVAPLVGDPAAPDGAPAAQDAPPQDGSIASDLTGTVQIVPEETTNSLLVRATAADWEIVQVAVQALDLRPLQVLIEVVIAEISETSDLDAGFEIQADSDGDDVDVGVGIGAVGAETRGAGDLVLDVMRAGSTSVDGFLSLLATDGSVEVLSRPVVLAQNNEEARILIGDERPFIQVFRSLPTDAAVRDQVVQYRDVGTALSILPTINMDGYVNLVVTQEVSTATSETQFGAPVISTREASTRLLVRDSQTVVIGGLIDRQETESESGVPLLKDIPLLGHLFKSTSRGLRRSELFIFLTPRIIATDEDAARIREGIENGTELLRPDTLPMRRFLDGVGAPENPR